MGVLLLIQRFENVFCIRVLFGIMESEYYLSEIVFVIFC